MRARRVEDSASEGDDEALALVARGDTRAALSALMARHGAGIYRFCRQMVRDEALAEDIHQQVFVEAFRDLSRYAGRSSLRTWLYGIARHRCLDAIKVAGRRHRRFVLADSPGIDDAAPGPSLAERVALAQAAIVLELCLDELAPATKSAVLLRYREELGFDEMAEDTGEKAGTLQARVARALPVLRRCLERRLKEAELPAPAAPEAR